MKKARRKEFVKHKIVQHDASDTSILEVNI